MQSVRRSVKARNVKRNDHVAVIIQRGIHKLVWSRDTFHRGICQCLKASHPMKHHIPILLKIVSIIQRNGDNSVEKTVFEAVLKVVKRSILSPKPKPLFISQHINTGWSAEEEDSSSNLLKYLSKVSSMRFDLDLCCSLQYVSSLLRRCGDSAIEIFSFGSFLFILKT